MTSSTPSRYVAPIRIWNVVSHDWFRKLTAFRDAFDRAIRLHEEQPKVNKTEPKTGEVQVRKEVHTEHQAVTVPVEREEVVIERRPAAGTAVGDIKAEEIRIPVREEKVHGDKR